MVYRAEWWCNHCKRWWSVQLFFCPLCGNSPEDNPIEVDEEGYVNGYSIFTDDY